MTNPQTTTDKLKIEVVAIAICRSKTCEGFNCCYWPANRGRLDCPVKRGCYDDAAAEAIGAIDAWEN